MSPRGPGLWERHVVPRIVDRTCGTEELSALRAMACAPLEGRVLELGFGSGLNLPHLPAAVTELAAAEPSDTAWRLAQPRVQAAQVPVRRSRLDGQRLADPDDSIDHVLLTFVLCTISDQRAALAETYRVLRPGGRVHFVEHGRAPEDSVVRWQRRLEPLQRKLAGGCHLTREPVRELEAAGLRVTDVDAFYLPGPRVARPYTFIYRGTARRRP